MPRIEAPKIRITAGQVDIKKGGVASNAVSVSEEKVDYRSRPLPDILAYLQEQTELTRATLVRILKESAPRRILPRSTEVHGSDCLHHQA